MKRMNPVTPSSRFSVFVSRDHLWSGGPYKPLSSGKSSTGGRNCQGRMTVRHRGGGHKRSYRVVQFKGLCSGGEAIVERIEYDPNRSAFIALVRDTEGGKRFYVLAPDGMGQGDVVHSGSGAFAARGNVLLLSDVPVGSNVYNIEVKPGKGGQLVRAAGTCARVLAKESDRVLLRLPSSQVVSISSSCRASIGVVSNLDHKNISLGKAGRSRWLGIRPSVRGVAMNPIDHPHGGGEGKSSGGRHPVSPTGVPAKGKKTVLRSRKRGSKLFRFMG